MSHDLGEFTNTFALFVKPNLNGFHQPTFQHALDAVVSLSNI